MDKLKFQYKALITMLSLITVAPLFIAMLYAPVEPDYITNIQFIQNLANIYNINLNECLKCQENGIVFGFMFILIFIVLVLLLFLISISIVATLLKLILGWSFKFTFSILIKSKYPKEWQKQNI